MCFLPPRVEGCMFKPHTNAVFNREEEKKWQAVVQHIR